MKGAPPIVTTSRASSPNSPASVERLSLSTELAVSVAKASPVTALEASSSLSLSSTLFGTQQHSRSFNLIYSTSHHSAFSIEMISSPETATIPIPSRSVFLDVDIGTGSTCDGLFNDMGKLLDSASSPIQIWKEGDCVRQSPTAIRHAICAAVKSACSLVNVDGRVAVVVD